MDMLNALRVRKRIVQVLDTHVLPALKAQVAVQVYAGVPLALSHVEHWTLFEPLLPDKSMRMQVSAVWENRGVLANRMPMLGFVFEGTSVERIGVTKTMAAEMRAAGQPVPAGVTGYRLAAPGAFYVPTNTPRNSGVALPAEQSLAQPEPLGILSFDLLEDEVLTRIFESNREGTHVLQIGEPALVKLGLEYGLAVERRDFVNGRALLTQFMQQMRHSLTLLSVSFANSSWPPMADEFPEFDQAPLADQQFCLRIIDYIQTHLHSPLTRTLLAQHMNVSAPYLNRIFLRTTGMTIMRFVTHCRIEAAKFILQASHQDRIGEIATLLGFATPYSFTSVFTRAVGISPSAYRRKHHPAKGEDSDEN